MTTVALRKNQRCENGFRHAQHALSPHPHYQLFPVHREHETRQLKSKWLVLLLVFGIGSARDPPQNGVAQRFNLFPVSVVGEAVGGVSEAVGDEKIGGNGVEGTFNKDMTNDEMTCEAHKQIVKPLSQTCDHIWRASVRSEKRVRVRTVNCCLYMGQNTSIISPHDRFSRKTRCVHGSCHCLDAKLPQRTTKTEKCASLQMQSGFK